MNRTIAIERRSQYRFSRKQTDRNQRLDALNHTDLGLGLGDRFAFEFH